MGMRDLLMKVGEGVSNERRGHRLNGLNVRFPPIADIGLDSGGPPVFAFRPRPDGPAQLMTNGHLDDAAPAVALTSAGWQITVEDVRGGFPLAADLTPDDHVLAGVGFRAAVGRNR